MISDGKKTVSATLHVYHHVLHAKYLGEIFDTFA